MQQNKSTRPSPAWKWRWIQMHTKFLFICCVCLCVYFIDFWSWKNFGKVWYWLHLNATGALLLLYYVDVELTQCGDWGENTADWISVFKNFLVKIWLKWICTLSLPHPENRWENRQGIGSLSSINDQDGYFVLIFFLPVMECCMPWSV